MPRAQPQPAAENPEEPEPDSVFPSQFRRAQSLKTLKPSGWEQSCLTTTPYSGINVDDPLLIQGGFDVKHYPSQTPEMTNMSEMTCDTDVSDVTQSAHILT